MESPSSVSRFIDADIFKEKQKLVENNCEDFIIKRDLIQYVWANNKPSNEFTYLNSFEGRQSFIQIMLVLVNSENKKYIDIANYVITNKTVDFKDIPDNWKENNLKVPDEWLESFIIN